MSHQRLGCSVADIPQIQHIGQVGQAEALGLGGKAAAARNGKHGVGLGPGRAQHPREVLVFEQVRHAEIVLTGLELRVPGKNALVGRNALHLLPGVVDNVHF